MANETDIGKRTKIATLTTHYDRSPPLLAHGAAVSIDPQGMVCLHFYADHYAIASEFTLFGEDNGDTTIEGGPPVGIRNVVATIVMTREAAARAASFLSGVLAETEDQEEEE